MTAFLDRWVSGFIGFGVDSVSTTTEPPPIIASSDRYRDPTLTGACRTASEAAPLLEVATARSIQTAQRVLIVKPDLAAKLFRDASAFLLFSKR